MPPGPPLLAVLIASLMLAGRGGGDEPTTFPPGVSRPQSKVSFLREADRICFSSESRIEAAGDDLLSRRGRPDPARVKRVALGVAVPALEAEVRAIGAIEPPPGDEDEVRAILDATRRGIAQIEADPGRLVNGPPPGLREAKRSAKRYGSNECGY